MDWQLAIERHRGALLRVLLGAIATAGLAPGATGQVLRREIWRALLRVLRPAEAALRRLIVIAARGITVRLRPKRALPDGFVIAAGGAARAPVFALLDPLRRPGIKGDKPVPGWAAPRIRLIGDNIADGAMPKGRARAALVDASALCRRIEAMRDALENLPREAKRLARWHMRRALDPRPGRVSTLRTGRPPGSRLQVGHAIDQILRECHALARMAPTAPDTS